MRIASAEVGENEGACHRGDAAEHPNAEDPERARHGAGKRCRRKEDAHADDGAHDDGRDMQGSERS
jgi:hypothetical protein